MRAAVPVPALAAILHKPTVRKILRFGITGGVGFIVDAGLLALLVELTSVPAWAARGISFPLALLSTWLLNRNWVFERNFQQRALGVELFWYAAIQIGGFLINYGSFVALLRAPVAFHLWYIVAIFVGAVLSAAFTFLCLNTGLMRAVKTDNTAVR